MMNLGEGRVLWILAAALVWSPGLQAATVSAPSAPAVVAAADDAKAQSKAIDDRQLHLKALDLAMDGKSKEAIQLLQEAVKKTKSAGELDREYLSLGRIQYQEGLDEEALISYSHVRKGSASWLEALEETSAAELRLGRPLKAIAHLKTVLTPYFKDRVTSEPYYLMALANLRICDYRSVFRILDLFKVRFRDKVKGWEGKTMDPGAQLSLAQTKKDIQKLNLIEAEAIQKLYVDETGQPHGGSVPRIARTGDQLSFPSDPDVDSKEVWLDEIDSYKVAAKGCPTAGM